MDIPDLYDLECPFFLLLDRYRKGKMRIEDFGIEKFFLKINSHFEKQKSELLRSSLFAIMRMAGLEPARSHPRQILSLMRLPVRHIRM